MLLFHGGAGVDVRHLARDSAAVFLLAIVAVFLSVGLIGGSLHAFSGVALTACLLLGTIIATTDPSAVISIFRELGAPARLTRLVEGEALLNDATAVAIFAGLLAAMAAGVAPSWAEMSLEMTLSFTTGAAAGIAAGVVLTMLLGALRAFRSAQVTLTLATPYLLFAACHMTHLVSGVVAVVASGITLGAIGRSRFDRKDFHFLHELLEQAADWSTGLIFILGALVIPRIMAQAEPSDLVLLVMVIGTATLARALVLWGVAPVLVRLGLMHAIGGRMNAALLWGGLRGAVTLALVLSVAENRDIPPDLKRTISVLATGYTLWTLLVQGTTLRLVIRALGLSELPAVERAFRGQALSRTLQGTRAKVLQFVARAGLDQSAVDKLMQPYEDRLSAVAEDGSFEEVITDTEKLRLRLAALVTQERNLLLDQRWASGLPSSMVDHYLFVLDRMRDEVFSGGRTGYLRAGRHLYRQTAQFRAANALHRITGIQAPLAAYLSSRFHTLLVMRTIVTQLTWSAKSELQSLLGERIADILHEIVARRAEEIDRNLEAIRLQYPEFARALETSMAERYLHHAEVAQIRELQEAGVIGEEIARSLVAEARDLHRTLKRPGRLDIEPPKPELLRALRAFEKLGDAELERIARRMTPAVVPADTVIYRPGDQVDSIYFIANGAIEIEREGEDEVIRLGRGEAFGQLRVLNPDLKPATVRALSYSHCYRMPVRVFREVLRSHPDWGTDVVGMRTRTAAE